MQTSRKKDFISIALPDFSLLQSDYQYQQQNDAEVQKWETQEEIKHILSNFYSCGMSINYLKKVDFANFQIINRNLYQTLLRKNAEVFLNNIRNDKCSNMVLFGTPGAGKTFTSLCVLKEVCKIPNYTIGRSTNGSKWAVKGFHCGLYRTSNYLCEDLRLSKSFKSKENYFDVLEKYCNKKLLIIDEIGRANTKDERDFIFDVIDRRIQNNLCSILISNFTWDKFQDHVGDALISRLQTNLVLHGTDRDTLDMRAQQYQNQQNKL